MRNTILICVATLGGWCLPSAARAATYYVSASGGDDQNPGTQASPWGSIQLEGEQWGVDPLLAVFDWVPGGPWEQIDYHLLEGSPAVDAGAALTEVTDDFDGVGRPQEGGYDIGAFEYMSGICAPATCIQRGYVCGEWADGCGGTLTCGTCASDEQCNASGQCEVACGENCNPDPDGGTTDATPTDKQGGCGCSASPMPAPLLPLLGFLWLWIRRACSGDPPGAQPDHEKTSLPCPRNKSGVDCASHTPPSSAGSSCWRWRLALAAVLVSAATLSCGHAAGNNQSQDAAPFDAGPIDVIDASDAGLIDPRCNAVAQPTGLSPEGHGGCFIHEGDVHCFGDNKFGEGSPPSRAAFVDVYLVGRTSACGRKTDGSYECWGLGYSALAGKRWEAMQTDAVLGSCGIRDGRILCDQSAHHALTPTETGFAELTVSSQWCALKLDGTARCWPRRDDDDDPHGALIPPEGVFSAITSALATVCGLRADGSALCWGDTTAGRADLPDGQSWAQISLGPWHGCGLTTAGTVLCWGDPPTSQTQGYLDVPVFETPVAHVAVGTAYSCAVLSSGGVRCWGPTAYPVAPSPEEEFQQVSIKGLTVCGVSAASGVLCWDGRADEMRAPSSSPFVQVSRGNYHACGVKQDGTISCWGNPGSLSPPMDRFAFLRDDYVFVDSGTTWACALTTTGQVECVKPGLNSSPEGSYRQVAVAAYYPTACGISAADGSIACWGYDGILQVPPSGSFLRIGVGKDHACGLREDGTIACWGDEAHGAGIAREGSDYVDVGAGYDRSCALTEQGTVHCWGGFTYAIEYVHPEGFVTLLVNRFQECAVTASGETVCNGRDLAPWRNQVRDIALFGQEMCWLNYDGEGHCTDLRGSSNVAGLSKIVAGSNHACGLLPDGTAHCWLHPYAVTDEGEADVPEGWLFTKLSTGTASTCGLGGDGRVICWGAETIGGVATPEITNAVDIDSYGTQYCALLDDGSIQCWTNSTEVGPHGEALTPPDDLVPMVKVAVGGSEYGQDRHACGLDDTGAITCFGTNELVVVQAPSGQWQDVVCGEDHCCALDHDGMPYCWGTSAASIAPNRPFVSIRSGGDTACGVDSERRVTCWGQRNYGWPGVLECAQP